MFDRYVDLEKLCLFFQTQLLESVLTEAYEGDEDSLLGEWQFTFVAFLVRISSLFFSSIRAPICYYKCTAAYIHMEIMESSNLYFWFMHKFLQMGQSLEAFLQWKLLIGLLLGCTEAVSTNIYGLDFSGYTYPIEGDKIHTILTVRIVFY